MTSRTLKSILMATVAVGGVSFAGGALAQEAAKADEKVTVTGSRIRSRDFTSTSPISTVTAKDIALTGTVNVEELINSLPQVIPGVTISSNNPSLNGFATADLRGLGAGRTLILVNGRRANPSAASGLVDLNTIPASLIERIEIVSGGASAVYGADAVAGAINFILKDNFEGLELGGSYYMTEDGHDALVVDGIMGGKFDSGRGSIQASMQYYTRDKIDASERAFSRYARPVLSRGGQTFTSDNPADLAVPGTSAIFSGGSGTAPWGIIRGFTAANVNTVYLAQPGAAALDNDCNTANGITATGGNIRFRAGGGISPFQGCVHPNLTSGNVDSDGDRYNFAPDNYLVLGNERVNAAMMGKYDIVEGGVMQAFFETTFTNSKSTQQLAATPATGLVIKYDLDPAVGSVVVNPYVRAQTSFYNLATLQFGGVQGAAGEPGLDNRSFLMDIRTTQVGNRFGEIETNAFGTNYGVRGNIPSLDWDWEIYHGYARNSTTVKNDNSIGKTAFTQLLNACNTTSVAPQLAPLGALPNCVFPHNSAAGGTFVPTATANNPLGFFALSDAMVNFIRVNSTDTIVYERHIVSGNMTGDLFDLWGEGMVSMALGLEYRNESLDNRVDPAKGSGDIIGFNAQESIAGGYDVYEAYGEVKIPLITGEAFIDNLSLEAGYRVSDYSTGAGITHTYKYGAEWSPWSWLTFRAIENHAVRAPSAFELFRNGDQNFPSYVDPCDKDTFTANNAACTAWFAQFGAVFVPGAFDQNNAQVQAFLFGNPNLTPEIADTLTYGVVFNPEWWPVGRLGISVDRYEIELDNQIGQRSIATIMNGCRDAIIANGNVFPVGNQFCDVVTRDGLGGGQVSEIDQSLANFVGISIYSGIDVNLKWSTELEGLGLPGTFGITSNYTWTDESDGSVGLYVGSIGGVISEHKAATNFQYSLDDWDFNLRWAYSGGVEDAVFGLGTKLPEYHLFDFGGAWQIDEQVRLSFGVDNLFDEQPVQFDGGVGAGQFNTDTSQYDVLGRQFRIGVKWKN